MVSISILCFQSATRGHYDGVSPQTAIGYLTSVIGFGFYNYAKIKAKEQDDAEEAMKGAGNFDVADDPERQPLVGIKVGR